MSASKCVCAGQFASKKRRREITEMSCALTKLLVLNFQMICTNTSLLTTWNTCSSHFGGWTICWWEKFRCGAQYDSGILTWYSSCLFFDNIFFSINLLIPAIPLQIELRKKKKNFFFFFFCTVTDYFLAVGIERLRESTLVHVRGFPAQICRRHETRERLPGMDQFV